MLNYKDEITVDFTEEDFIRVQSQLRYHLEMKGQGSLVDYIIDFCNLHSMRIEDIAEVINTDKELKSIIKQDCVFHKIFRTESNRLDDWE